MVLQKIFGLVFLVSALFPIIIDHDGTAALMLVPLGLGIILSRKNVLCISIPVSVTSSFKRRWNCLQRKHSIYYTYNRKKYRIPAYSILWIGIWACRLIMCLLALLFPFALIGWSVIGIEQLFKFI